MEKRKANYDPMLTLLPKPNRPVINIIPEICMYYTTQLETQNSYVREEAISHRFHPVVCATLMRIFTIPIDMFMLQCMLNKLEFAAKCS